MDRNHSQLHVTLLFPHLESFIPTMMAMTPGKLFLIFFFHDSCKWTGRGLRRLSEISTRFLPLSRQSHMCPAHIEEAGLFQSSPRSDHSPYGLGIAEPSTSGTTCLCPQVGSITDPTPRNLDNRSACCSSPMLLGYLTPFAVSAFFLPSRFPTCTARLTKHANAGGRNKTRTWQMDEGFGFNGCKRLRRLPFTKNSATAAGGAAW